MNGLTMFDLLPDLTLSTVTYNGINYYLYTFTELSTAGEDTYQFLWK